MQDCFLICLSFKANVLHMELTSQCHAAGSYGHWILFWKADNCNFRHSTSVYSQY